MKHTEKLLYYFEQSIYFEHKNDDIWATQIVASFQKTDTNTVSNLNIFLFEDLSKF